MMSPREALAHYLDSYLNLTRQSGARFSRVTGVNKAWVCAALHPGDYRDSKSAIPGKLDEVLDVLDLTLAPRDHTVPSVAQVTEMIDRMKAPPSAKRVAKAAVHAAGLMKET